MNDFTKEELEEIAEMMRHARKQGVETQHNLSYQVEYKAWKMIDNYCDHKPHNPDCYCEQIDNDGITIKDCGYPPHNE